MLILKPLLIDWSVAGAKIPAVTFIAQAGLTTRELAHMLDSLALPDKTALRPYSSRNPKTLISHKVLKESYR